MKPRERSIDGPRCIAIVGGSGSGKSWLASRLQAELGREAALVSLDDFYRDLGHLPPGERDATNFDDPDAIDWDAVAEAMDTLLRGESARIPSYDFVSHTRAPSGRVQPAVRFLLMEGLWLLHHPGIRRRFDLGVFVDCPDAERMRRRIERDVATRGRTADSVRAQFDNHVRPMHDRFVEPQRAEADRVVGSPLSDSDFAGLLCDLRGLSPSDETPVTTI